MNRYKMKLVWLALLALLVILGGCKGESPTAPPPGGPAPPTGTPPPAGVNVVVTTSNTDPLVDSTVVITATVTDNGTPVPNGTAVEFSTTNGTFTDTGASTTIRTTTNGVATATLTSSVAGASRTTVVVNNVARTIDVTFRARPVTPPPPNTAPTITSVTPSVGRPAGGETIRITGTNFTGPVRVLFDVGTGTPVEGFVVNRTDTTIDVITPAVNLGAGQELISRIIVITGVGSTTEQRVEVTAGFTFRNVSLTPVPRTLSPASGPIEGGTRISIFGEGFQEPVQVFFGFGAVPSWQEARVIETRFNEIIVEAPDARSTSPNGGATVTGPVDVRVVNINSGTEAILGSSFRYISKMQITTVRPLVGPALGGTELTIDGTGFNSPLIVTVNGVEARVIEVSGTRVRAITGPATSPCATTSALPSIFVTNTDNGDTDAWADAPNETGFTYLGVNPAITSVPASVVAGTSATITVDNPGIGPLGSAEARIVIGDRTIIPSPSQITTGTGTTTFTFAVPISGFNFPTVACTTAVGGEPGTRLGATDVPVTFRNATTGCTDAATLVVLPPEPNACLAPPSPVVTNPPGGTCAAPAPASVTGVGFPTTTAAGITIANGAESAPLNISAVTITGAAASEFRINPTTATNIGAGGSANFTLTFDPATAGAKEALVTFTTNSTTTPTIVVCVQATAAP